MGQPHFLHFSQEQKVVPQFSFRGHVSIEPNHWALVGACGIKHLLPARDGVTQKNSRPSRPLAPISFVIQTIHILWSTPGPVFRRHPGPRCLSSSWSLHQLKHAKAHALSAHPMIRDAFMTPVFQHHLPRQGSIFRSFYQALYPLLYFLHLSWSCTQK